MMRSAHAGLILVAFSLFGTGCTTVLPDVGSDDGELQLLGRNRWAARQRSTTGRSIQTVEYHQGQVYVGFGDWRANTGPVQVSSWDIAQQDWLLHLSAGTEAIERFHTTSTGLLAPFTDPERPFDYALGPPWRQQRATGANKESFFHVFDVAETTAGRFMIGTRRDTGEALVMREQKEGEWTSSLLLAGSGDWFWFGAVIDDTLIVQSERQGSYRLRNGNWEATPPLFSNPRMRAMVSVGERVAGISRAPAPRRFRSDLLRAGYLHVSDGEELLKDSAPTALDLNIDQDTGWVYLLRSNGIERSRDLLEWQALPLPLPPGATAIDVANGQVWIGTADSSLWLLNLLPTTNPD